MTLESFLNKSFEKQNASEENILLATVANTAHSTLLAFSFHSQFKVALLYFMWTSVQHVSRWGGEEEGEEIILEKNWNEQGKELKWL